MDSMKIRNKTLSTVSTTTAIIYRWCRWHLWTAYRRCRWHFSIFPYCEFFLMYPTCRVTCCAYRWSQPPSSTPGSAICSSTPAVKVLVVPILLYLGRDGLILKENVCRVGGLYFGVQVQGMTTFVDGTKSYQDQSFFCFWGLYTIRLLYHYGAYVTKKIAVKFMLTFCNVTGIDRKSLRYRTTLTYNNRIYPCSQ